MFDPNLPDDCQGSDPSFPWNQIDIEEDDRLSKGSDCCKAPVRRENGGTTWCTECAEECTELFEDDDEYLDRVHDEQEEARAERQLDARQDYLDAYNDLSNGY